MNKNHIQLTGLFLLITLLSISCAHVGYVGHSLEPTAEVDLYCSKEDIEKEYTVMGHAIGTGTSNNDAIQQALMKEAQNRGADAILITGIGFQRSIQDLDELPEGEVKALFLKYK